MWEVRAAPGRLAELIEWIGRDIVSSLRDRPGCRGVEVYQAGADERAVVIAHFDAEPGTLPEPPEELVHRPVHQWPFQLVHAEGAGWAG
jgi:hypothetical protein